MTGTIYSGSYLNGIVLADPATQRPATVTGSVSNKNGDTIYGKPVARWTVANEGTIQNTGSAGYGVDLVSRGTVENGVSGAIAALISGYGGVWIRGALATVGNLGTISGTGTKRDGVELKAGGQVSNGNTDTTAALISGGRRAVVIRNAAGTVANFGTLTSSGTYNTVALFAGGNVTNGSKASTEALTSSDSASAVDVNGTAGTVINFGTIDGGSAAYGVVLSDDGTVANFGTIKAGYDGVFLRSGSVTNGSTSATGALISSPRFGVYIAGGTGTVTNFRTIDGRYGYGRGPPGRRQDH